MKTVTLSYPEMFMLIGTRALLAAGIGLLVAPRLRDVQRQTAGLVLAAVGLLTTLPLAFEVLGKTERV